MKQLRKLKAFRADSRGLTLVELIVGITLLAIIITPLLHAFVTGANTERKGRQYGEATVAAENLAETVQASGLSQLPAALGKLGTLEISSSPFKLTGVREGSSTFDATITLTPSAKSSNINADKIAISNSMDGVIDMTGADVNGKAAYENFLALYNTPITVKPLERSNIIVTAVPIAGSDKQFTLTANISYSASISYTKDGKPGARMLFSHTETASVRVSGLENPAKGEPIFSVFLFLRQDISSTAKDLIVIKNNTSNPDEAVPHEDFNLFLVYPENTQHAAQIQFIPQYDRNAKRVFTNLSSPTGGSITYYACDRYGWGYKQEITGKLVESYQLNRFFDVTVALYKPATTELIYSLETTKLN